MPKKKKKKPAIRNPVAASNRRVNRHKVERDKTKYRRKEKYQNGSNVHHSA